MRVYGLLNGDRLQIRRAVNQASSGPHRVRTIRAVHHWAIVLRGPRPIKYWVHEAVKEEGGGRGKVTSGAFPTPQRRRRGSESLSLSLPLSRARARARFLEATFFGKMVSRSRVVYHE